MTKTYKILYYSFADKMCQQIQQQLGKTAFLFDFYCNTSLASFNQTLDEIKPDLVFSDYGEEGVETQKALKLAKKHNNSLPFVVLSRTNPPDTIFEMFDLGLYDYVTKPNMNRLPFLIKKVVEAIQLKEESKLKMETLRKREAILLETERLAHVGSWHIIMPGKNIIWSDESYRIYGYHPHEVVVNTDLILAHVYPCDKLYVEEMISSIYAGDQSNIIFEFRIIDKQGELKYLRSEIHLLKDDDGKITDISGFNQDITVIKLHAQENRKQGQFYKKLIENSADMKTLRSEDGTILWISPSVTKILGYAVEDLVGLGGNFLTHPNDIPIVQEVYEKTFSSEGKPYFFEQRIRHKDGTYRWCEGSVTNWLHDEDIHARVANFRDITARKENELKLAEVEKRYEIIFNANPLPTWIFDFSTFKFLFVNKAAVTKYGYSNDEFLQMKVTDIIPADKLDYFIDEYNKGGSYYSKHKTKAGKEISVELITDTLIFNNHPVQIAIINDITDSEIALEALRKSNANLQTIFDHTETAYILLDTDRTIISFNKVVDQWAGVLFKNPLKTGIDLLSIIDDDRRENTKSLINEVLRSEAIEYESEYKGTWFYSRISPVTLMDQKKVGVILSIENITERKLAEKRLKQNEVHLMASQRIGNLGSWEMAISKDGENYTIKPEYWSDQLYTLFGHRREDVDFIGDRISKQTTLEDQQRAYHKILDAIRTGSKYSQTHKLIKKNGEVVFVKNHGELVYDEVTKLPIKLIGTTQDISQQKKAKLELQKSEANLKTIFDNTDTGYLLLDLNMNIISFNHIIDDWTFQNLGFKLQEGIKLHLIIPPTNSTHMLEYVQKTLQGETITFEAPFYPFPDKKPVWFFVKFFPVKNKNRENMGCIMSLVNITEKKEAEEERADMTRDLMLRNKDLEKFTYIVSHNLRGPVANILGSTGLMKEENLDPDINEMVLAGIDISVKKLDEVINDLNHILQKKNPITEIADWVVLPDLLEEIKAEFEIEIKTDRVTIISDFGGFDKIKSIKSYLNSILSSLISNSVKFRKESENPVIRIQTQIVGKIYRIIFKDNSLGINLAKHHEHVFGLYKQFQIGADGKGMGLFMVKTMVETLGGTIHLISDTNMGCEYIIDFNV